MGFWGNYISSSLLWLPPNQQFPLAWLGHHWGQRTSPPFLPPWIPLWYRDDDWYRDDACLSKGLPPLRFSRPSSASGGPCLFSMALWHPGCLPVVPVLTGGAHPTPRSHVSCWLPGRDMYAMNESITLTVSLAWRVGVTHRRAGGQAGKQHSPLSRWGPGAGGPTPQLQLLILQVLTLHPELQLLGPLSGCSLCAGVTR